MHRYGIAADFSPISRDYSKNTLPWYHLGAVKHFVHDSLHHQSSRLLVILPAVVIIACRAVCVTLDALVYHSSCDGQHSLLHVVDAMCTCIVVRNASDPEACLVLLEVRERTLAALQALDRTYTTKWCPGRRK